MRLILCLGFVASLAACAGTPELAASGAGSPPDWREIATPEDRARIRNWRSAFTEALAAAREAGHGAEIRREGALLMPDAALPSPALPEGEYRCRVIKVGGKSEAMLDYIAYPGFRCRVEQDGTVAHFEKLTGSQRPVGAILDGNAERQIFLGTLVLGDERRALAYGVDAERNLAGAVERVGEARWRLVLPFPRFESILDVIELVPAERTAAAS